jgi:hypothetical protein
MKYGYIFFIFLLSCVSVPMRAPSLEDAKKNEVSFFEKYKLALEVLEENLLTTRLLLRSSDEKSSRIRTVLGDNYNQDLVRMNLIDKAMNSVGSLIAMPSSKDDDDEYCVKNPSVNGMTSTKDDILICAKAFARDASYLAQTIAHEFVHLVEFKSKHRYLYRNDYSEAQYGNSECRASRIEMMLTIIGGGYPQNTSKYFYNDCRLGVLAKALYMEIQPKTIALFTLLKPKKTQFKVDPSVIEKTLRSQDKEGTFNDEIGFVENPELQMATRECFITQISVPPNASENPWTLSELSQGLIQNDQVEETVMKLVRTNDEKMTVSCNAFGRIPFQLSDLKMIFKGALEPVL